MRTSIRRVTIARPIIISQRTGIMHTIINPGIIDPITTINIGIIDPITTINIGITDLTTTITVITTALITMTDIDIMTVAMSGRLGGWVH